MKRRIITISLLAPLALTMFVFPLLSPNARVFQERRGRRPPARRVRAAPSSTTAQEDYSRFSHRSRSHQQACAACHQTPTPNWSVARGFPDIADYPGHASCISCHRQQFFKGARPAICTICHTSASPRDDARFAFGRPNAAHQVNRLKDLRQFTIEFPHDKHQDVIARLSPALRVREELSFVPASFKPDESMMDDKKAQFNNCTICHETNQTKPAPPGAGWPGGFVPVPETFKTVPASHASCFNCHWKSQPPTKDDCAGCHKAAAAFIPQNWSSRISAKFIHEGGGPNKDHVMECTTCHINITKASTLRGLKPDVPIAACATCHNNDMQGNTYKQITTIEMELDQLEKTRSCNYCHTPDVGRKEAPGSHCLAVGWPLTKCSNNR
jgi:hypothetical protein